MPGNIGPSNLSPGGSVKQTRRVGTLAQALSIGYKNPVQVQIRSEQVHPPGLRQFNLTEAGIDQGHFFRAIAGTFDSLPIDSYEQRYLQVAYLLEKFPKKRERLEKFLPDYYGETVSIEAVSDIVSGLAHQDLHHFKRLGCSERRAIARFEAFFHIAKFPDIRRVNAGSFIRHGQSGLCAKDVPRFYEEASTVLTEHACFRQLLRIIALMTKGLNRNAYSLLITLHQTSISADKNQRPPNAESIQQHGADFVVPAMPVLLDNVSVPVNTVYASQDRIVYKARLKTGEGLFIDDKLYRHSVSPPRSQADYGKRCALGFDVEVVAQTPSD